MNPMDDWCSNIPRRWARLLSWPHILLTFLFLVVAAGCTPQQNALMNRLPDVLDGLPEAEGLSEDLGDLNSLTQSAEALFDQYRDKYALSPRPAIAPKAVAEAYLARYQPGPLPRIAETTYLYDRSGVPLAELYADGRRTWVPLERISRHLIDAIIATEDATFYTNAGIDPLRVIGAFMQNAEAGGVVSGASTITMQLARNLFFAPEVRFEQSLDRKVLETFLAQDLNALYTKDEILEMYLNLIYFGHLAYGPEAAARTYFGKSASDLTVAEATLLAGIPQRPADLDPFVNFEAAKQRQRTVLDLMVRRSLLTPQEADDVFQEPVTLNADPNRRPILAPHFVQYVTSALQQELANHRVDRAGLRVFTTLDLRMQDLAQAVVAEQVEILEPRFGLTNAALIALKPGTSEILAMVGSADYANPQIDGQVNVAVWQRQPGSAIKPVFYAVAMDDNLISPSTVLWDVPARYRISEKDTYSPRNYDDKFHGPVTVRTALANSYNVPAVKLIDAVGVTRMLEGARALGLRSLNRDATWYGLSLVLGGGEVSLLDLTTAYQTLANQGRRVTPKAVMFYTDTNDTVGLTPAQPESEQVITPETAFLVTDILSDNQARTPAFGSNSALLLSRPAAAKTGTTSDFRDNWTLGYTRYLVAGVWAGNSDGRPMRNASGVTGAAPIWHEFMEAVLADPELLALLGAPEDPAAWEFVPPSDIVELKPVCPPGLTCRPEGERYAQRWLEKMGEAGPMGDSVAEARVAKVYVNRGSGNERVGVCSREDGVAQTVLRLPDRLGLLGTSGHADDTQAENEPVELSKEVLDTIRQERQEIARWSVRQSAWVYLGPCDQVEALVRAIYGDSAQSVVLYAMSEDVAEITGEGGQTAAAVAPQTVSFVGPTPGRYTTIGVTHDANCGGSYILGQTLAASGQAVPNQRVLFADDFGNRQEQRTSSNAATLGSYRFPILSEDPHKIMIYVLAEDGGVISETAMVNHRQGQVAELSCHYVLWVGTE